MTAVGAVTLALVILAMVLLAVLARPQRASAVDFYLAGQRIGTLTNALAICGDYFSAASFLGVAAAVYVSGLDGAWYATGFAAGFVPVILLVAAPLRRFGHLSLPDFLSRRLHSPAVRIVSVVVVQLIILSYLIPQAIASGITWALVVDVRVPGLSSYATGVIAAGALICGLVALGGMRATTWAQAVQFLFLLAVLVWLAIVVLTTGFRYSEALGELGRTPLANPVITDDGWRLAPSSNGFHPGTAARFDQPGARYDGLSQFALVVTLVMGTAGLPHVMNRYFTAPTGRAARFTTVWVLGGAGVFYFLAVMLGVAARATIGHAARDSSWLAALTTDGVLRVPEHALLALGRLHGDEAGFAVVAIAALVAVLSTMGGLLLAAATSWGFDVYQMFVNPRASQTHALHVGRLAVGGTALLATVFALPLQPEALSASFPSVVATMVTWAFALAGSTLTPMLILVIWWRGATASGVVAGLAVGALTSIAMFGFALSGNGPALLSTPTPIAASVALLVAVGVSRSTEPPHDIDDLWRRLHGTAADRHAERLARLTIQGVAP